MSRAGVLRKAIHGVLAALGVLVLGLILFAPPLPQTDASYTDPEFAGGTGVSAVRLVPPQITAVTTCRSALLGGNIMVITWKWSAQTAPYSGFTAAANTEWQIAGTAWQAVPTTGPDANGVYTTTFTSSLLSGLLGGLLGESFSSNVRTKAWTGWVSPTVSTLTYTKPILNSPTCGFANGS
ncbi:MULTISPECIES: hypothetical protein [unclassified Microbacterium]|uniref:hypothetical protein n=1 Tax=unclassified Microbacterium TaxID=2609290 RepID=UPI003652E05B